MSALLDIAARADFSWFVAASNVRAYYGGTMVRSNRASICVHVLRNMQEAGVASPILLRALLQVPS